nr:type II toxin-antitoxin system RelE/ParE family toxin [Streptomyces sp. 8K308]
MWSPQARRAMTTYRKDDPGGIDQVLDSVNLLRKHPRPPGAQAYGRDLLRIRVGRYRVRYEIVNREPLVPGIETVGRTPGP